MEIIKKVFIIIADLFCALMAFIFFAGAIYVFIDNMTQVMRFAKEGVMPLFYIFEHLFIVGILIMMALFMVRIVLGKRAPEKFRYSSIVLAFIVCALGGAGFSMQDDIIRDEFRRMRYYPSVENEPVRTMTETYEINYDDYNVLPVEGWFTCIENAFRSGCPVEVVYDSAMTDRIAADVYYRGVKIEIYMREDSDGLYISVWADDWQENDPTKEDIAYMYKNGIDLEYADKFAVESVIIRTAYPEKIDVSGMRMSN